MPSDAHELAARLHRKALNVNPKWVELERAAAVELERLADVETERDRLREALRFAKITEDRLREVARVMACHPCGFCGEQQVWDIPLLASAGPPQETADFCFWCGTDHADGACKWSTAEVIPPVPPPERRCTCGTDNDRFHGPYCKLRDR